MAHSSMTALLGLTEDMKECIDECVSCHNICLAAVAHCLASGGAKAEAANIRLLHDCAEMCATSANFLLRGSSLHRRTCAVCAEVCERCDQELERFEDDQILSACAEACWRCSLTCRRMAA